MVAVAVAVAAGDDPEPKQTTGFDIAENEYASVKWAA